MSKRKISTWLTPRMHEILMVLSRENAETVDSYANSLTYCRGTWMLGAKRLHQRTVNRLLWLGAIAPEKGDSNVDYTNYWLTEAGQQVRDNPDYNPPTPDYIKNWTLKHESS